MITGAARYVYALVSELVPPGVVSATVTVPAEPAGAVTVTDVSLAASTVPGTPPKVTPVAPAIPEPLIVTEVPPVVGPDAGVMVESAGGARYVKPVEAVPPTVVTTTVEAPAERDGVVIRIDVSLSTVNDAAAPPTVTFVVLVKLVPVIVAIVPPAMPPLVGLMLLIVGGATYVHAFAAEEAVPPGVVTETVPEPAEPAAVVATISVTELTT